MAQRYTLEQSKETFKSVCNQVLSVKTLSPDLKASILEKYKILADAFYEPTSNSGSEALKTVESNKGAYENICKSIVYRVLKAEFNNAPYAKQLRIDPNLSKLMTNQASFTKAYRKLVGQDNLSDIDIDKIKTSIELFGVDAATEVDKAADDIIAADTEAEEAEQQFAFDKLEDLSDIGEEIIDEDEIKAIMAEEDPIIIEPSVEPNIIEPITSDEPEEAEEFITDSDLEEEIKLDAERQAKELEERQAEEEKKEEKRKESLKTGDISGKANDISKDETPDDELIAAVDNIVTNIIYAYDKLYRPLFLNPPRGVLFTKENGSKGIMCVGKSGEADGVKVHDIPSINFFMGFVYKAILNRCPRIKEAPKVGDDGMSIKANWMHPDGTIEYNYAPHIQVRNCMGVYRDKETGKLRRAKTWQEFKSKISSELKPTIMAMLKRVDKSSDETIKRACESIQEFYTTIFLVNEFDKDKALRMTAYNTSSSMSGDLSQIADAIRRSNFLSKATIDDYKLMNNSEKNGVQDILIVTNDAKYRGEINFAYKTLGKILMSGGSIDLSHTIVGTDLSGSPVEINLNNNAYVSIGIVAGSRSGKGVLTMSILASMLAAKCPVVYLDYKPDMAGIFWKLERKYNVPILAIDGKSSVLDGERPVRAHKAGYGSPRSLVDDLGDKLNVIPYVKGIQIMNLIGGARVAGKIPSNNKMFFVLDEAQQCSQQIAENTKAIASIRDKNKPKGKAEPTEEYKYLVKLSKVFESTTQAATTFMNTNAGSGNMSALILGQQANAAEWKGPLANLMLKCAIKFLGNGTVGGSQYGLNNKIKGVGMIGTGYFGLSTSGTPNEDNTTIIKTTLVLNDGDFNVDTMKGGKYTGALLNNIKDETLKEDTINNDMIVSESNTIALEAGAQLGSANPLVGFPGLIEFMGKANSDFDLSSALNAGYREVATILGMLGIVGPNCPYKDVESYMYSGKEDSLFTSGQLDNALANNMTIYDYIKNGPKDEESLESEGSDGSSEQGSSGEIIGAFGGTESSEAGFDSTNSDKMPDEQLLQIVDMIIKSSGLNIPSQNMEQARNICITFLRKRGW